MNEQEFSLRWKEEHPMYDAWGEFVVSRIEGRLRTSGRNLSSFLKQPCKHRVKDESSLIDKAFYRGKEYINPFDDIEDKVGCRFVVLLVEQINEITDIITQCDDWDFIECRHFSHEREKAPLLFTYQSVHYVVKSNKELKYNGTTIAINTPCEIQIRTLLQHAYAELTHDAIYKAKTLVEPKIHRTVAKSMALIETTDDFFSIVNQSLNIGVAEDLSFQDKLDELYSGYIGLNCTPAQKSSIVILDAYKEIIKEDTIDKIEAFLNKEYYISELIKSGRVKYPFYTQGVIVFLYFLIKKHKRLLLKEWPLDRMIIRMLASEIGVSLEDFG